MTASHPDPLEDAFYTAKASGLPFLSDIGPMILAASYLGIASDTRSFARKFEQAHALVIRELSSLAQELNVLETKETPKTSSRIMYRLNSAGQALFEERSDHVI
jgi:hypothetical protein